MFPVGFDIVTATLVEAQLTKTLREHRLLKIRHKPVRKSTIRYLLLIASILKKKATHQPCSGLEKKIVALAERIATRSFNHEALNWESFYGFCLRAASYIRDTYERPLVDDEAVFLAKMRRFFETLADDAHTGSKQSA